MRNGNIGFSSFIMACLESKKLECIVLGLQCDWKCNWCWLNEKLADALFYVPNGKIRLTKSFFLKFVSFL
jgi:hypothetical protein